MWDPICFDLPGEWKSSLVTCEKFSRVHISPASPIHTAHCTLHPCAICTFSLFLCFASFLTFSLFRSSHLLSCAKDELTRHDADVWTGKEIGRHYSKCSPVTLIRHKLRPHSTFFSPEIAKNWAQKTGKLIWHFCVEGQKLGRKYESYETLSHHFAHNCRKWRSLREISIMHRFGKCAEFVWEWRQLW